MNVSNSLSVWPFKMITGIPPKGPADPLVTHTAAQPGALQTDEIRVSAAEFIRVAKAHGNYMRKQRQSILNYHSRLLRNRNVGDRVKFVIPPLQGEADRRKRR